jgi:hypothetical protein
MYLDTDSVHVPFRCCSMGFWGYIVEMPIQSEGKMATTPRSNELTSIEHGCFDTAALQQELAQALEDDRVYKLTDSMKKRAIHTATNYDEFKVQMSLYPFFSWPAVRHKSVNFFFSCAICLDDAGGV